jgi:hypothetical protein
MLVLTYAENIKKYDNFAFNGEKCSASSARVVVYIHVVCRSTYVGDQRR